MSRYLMIVTRCKQIGLLNHRHVNFTIYNNIIKCINNDLIPIVNYTHLFV